MAEGIEGLMAPQAMPQEGADDSLNMIGGFLQALSAEDKSALQGIQQDMAALEPDELAALSDLLTFLQANPEQYESTVAELTQDGTLDAGDLPAEYEPRYLNLLNALAQSAMPAQAPDPQAFAQGGLASLAAAGRGGDSMLAHVTPGEAHLLRSRGGAGTINPATGQPEFFFKKAWSGVKSIGKGIGGALKGATKVLKKAAPIALPIALNVMFPGLGTIASGALGAGLGTAINGGSLSDSLKAAATGGAVGGVASGLQGMAQGQGFMAGVQGGLPAGMRPAQQALAQAAQPISSDLDPASEAFLSGGDSFGVQPSPVAQAPESLIDRAKQFYGDHLSPNRGMPTAADVVGSQDYQAMVNAGVPAEVAMQQVQQQMTPGMLSRYGPMAALGLGAAYAGGMFDEPELRHPGIVDSTTGFDLFSQNPGAYSGFQEQVPNQGFTPAPPPPPQYTQAGPTAPPQIGIPSLVERFQQGFAHGGAAHFQGAVSGPGTEQSDDIPGWLSDGEFVLTARAVRGAGGGDRARGVQTLYELMHQLEGRG